MPVTISNLLSDRPGHKAAYDHITLSRAEQMPSETRDHWIEWRASSVSVLKHYPKPEGGAFAMQRQFTIELRVDFADADKLEPLKQTLQQAARHAYATAQLISDNPKLTQIAIYSDDFFTGHKEISLMDDVIQQGLDETGGAESGSDSISSELANAAKGL